MPLVELFTAPSRTIAAMKEQNRRIERAQNMVDCGRIVIADAFHRFVESYGVTDKIISGEEPCTALASMLSWKLNERRADIEKNLQHKRAWKYTVEYEKLRPEDQNVVENRILDTLRVKEEDPEYWDHLVCVSFEQQKRALQGRYGYNCEQARKLTIVHAEDNMLKPVASYDAYELQDLLTALDRTAEPFGLFRQAKWASILVGEGHVFEDFLLKINKLPDYSGLFPDPPGRGKRAKRRVEAVAPSWQPALNGI